MLYLQQQVQDIFQKIKDHNYCLEKIIELYTYRSSTDDFLKKASTYYQMLEETEKTLLVKIPGVAEELKKSILASPTLLSQACK